MSTLEYIGLGAVVLISTLQLAATVHIYFILHSLHHRIDNNRDDFWDLEEKVRNLETPGPTRKNSKQVRRMLSL